MMSARDAAVRTSRNTPPPAMSDGAARTRLSVVMSSPAARAASHTRARSSRVTGGAGATQRLDAPPETRERVARAAEGAARNSRSAAPAARLRAPGTGWSTTRPRPSAAPSAAPAASTMAEAALPIATTSTSPGPRARSSTWAATSSPRSRSSRHWSLIASASARSGSVMSTSRDRATRPPRRILGNDRTGGRGALVGEDLARDESIARLGVAPRGEQRDRQVGEAGGGGGEEGRPEVDADVVRDPQRGAQRADVPRGRRDALGVGLADQREELGGAVHDHRHARADDAAAPAEEDRGGHAQDDEVGEGARDDPPVRPRAQAHEDGPLQGQHDQAPEGDLGRVRVDSVAGPKAAHVREEDPGGERPARHALGRDATPLDGGADQAQGDRGPAEQGGHEVGRHHPSLRVKLFNDGDWRRR